MADYGVTATGLRIPTQAELLEDYKNLLRGEYGHDVDTGADSVFGHLAAIESNRMFAIYQILSDLYSSLDPSGAEGVPLDKVSDFSNIKRNPATYSTVKNVDFYGTAGTSIPAGTQVSVGSGGEVFETDAIAVIPVAGVVQIDVTASNSGAVRANAGTLNTIVTPVAGMTSVLNTTDAMLGSPIESDSDYRTRRARDLRIIGESIFGALRTQMLDTTNGVEGITELFLTHNTSDNDYTATGGLPPHSFEFTIEGGDDTEIAEKIFELAPAGIQSYTGASGADAKTIAVTDDFSNSHSISFSRRAETNMWAHVQIEVTDDFDTGIAQSNLIEVTVPSTSGYVTMQINGVTLQYFAVLNGSVTAFSNAGGGEVNVHSTAHGLISGVTVDITGTANYNGTYVITKVTDDIFKITAAWVATETGNWEKNGGADTAVTIAAGLTSAVNTSSSWVPVTATHDGVSDEFRLTGNYEGIPFIFYTATSSLSNQEASYIAASGDQLAVLEKIYNYAEGDGTDAGIQGIGDDVLPWKYKGPVGEVDNITSVDVYMLDSQPTAPPTTGWTEANIEVDNRHKALFDSTRITVEVI